MIEISPMEHSMIRLKIVEWSNKEQKDICVGDFEVSASNGELKVVGFKDWKTDHRDDIAVKYYLNEPTFRSLNFKPFQGVYIKQIVKDTTPLSTKLSTDDKK